MLCTVSHWHLNSENWVKTRSSLFGTSGVRDGNAHQFSPVRIIPPVLHTHFISLSLMLQGGSNMSGTDLCVNKPHCAAAVRP